MNYNNQIFNKIILPPSKSISQRAIVAALLSDGISSILNRGNDNDTLAAIRMAESLGASVDKDGNAWVIKGSNGIINNSLNIGESGLGLRMFSFIAALSGKEVYITGEGTLPGRPVDMLGDALKQGGVSVETSRGGLPIKLSGKLQGGDFNIDGSITSQVLTGLLMALPVVENDSIVHVESLKSKPYIDLTLDILKDFGIVVKNVDYKEFFIRGKQQYKSVDYWVEGDWSGAAFWFVAGAISGDIYIGGLNTASKQADRMILDAMESGGIPVVFSKGYYHVKKSKVRSFNFDATDCPDLIPVLCLLAACAEGMSSISGASRLKFKESDRALVLKQEFAKVGISVFVENDLIRVEGGRIGGGLIDCHNDHRIAMTFLIASLVAEAEITIDNPGCINKSYPEFILQFAFYLEYIKKSRSGD